MQSYIKCELNGKYETNSTEYQIWSFENNASSLKRLNICLDVPVEKEVFLSFTNFSTKSSAEISGGSENYQTKTLGDSTVHEDIHPDFIYKFNPLLYLEEVKGNYTKSVSSATGGGTGIVNVTSYAWKTSDNSTPSGKSCFLNQSYDPVQTTLRGVRSLFNGKTLRVWVADSDWDAVSPNTNGKLHPNKVNAVLDAVADTNGLSLYEKVLKITGTSEWGEHNFSTVLSSNYPYLDLVYYDINCDNILGGVVGFYFSGNNFLSSSVPHSNESLVLFVDSKYFTQRDDATWEITDKYPSLSLNTIAHELQHMIHFYEKVIKNKKASSTWFNEQLSMGIEEIISSYIQGNQNSIFLSSSIGLGRYAATSDCSLVEWNITSSTCDLIADYSHVLSYSAFLSRNYGVNLISDLLKSSEVDNFALDSVLGKYQSSYRESLHRLGVSMLLNPSKGSIPNGYGFRSLVASDFFGSGQNLSLPDANPYSYLAPPILYDSLPKTIGASSTLNLHWKKNLRGLLNEDIYMPPYTMISIVIGTYPRN